MKPRTCDECGAEATLHRYCGAYVCTECNHHNGLARCYCGWATSGGNGRSELIELGETIEEEE